MNTVPYLYFAHRLTEDFYKQLKLVLMDRPRFAFRQLDKALFFLGLLCILSPLSDFAFWGVALILIALAVEAIVKQDGTPIVSMPATDRYDAREKARRLKEAVAANRLYEDAELTLATLAEKLKIHPHELSRIINSGLEKNFADFINEFRVREVMRRMQDPANDQLTLMGIAYDAGFNSQRTFNRVFKEMTGKTPAEYKNDLKKEWPIDKLAGSSRLRPVILRSGSPPIWAASTLKRNTMFRNYFKLAYRNIIRDKAYSAINISGLAIGLAASILILLWVQNELSYDQFHNNAGQIYRVASDFGDAKMSANSAGMPAGLKAELPVVKNTVRIQPSNPVLFEAGGKKFQEEHVFYADASFLDVFSYSLIQGNAATALKQPDAILITQEMAAKYFGDGDPVGKIIKKENKENVVVTGVLVNIPANSNACEGNYQCYLMISDKATGYFCFVTQ